MKTPTYLRVLQLTDQHLPYAPINVLEASIEATSIFQPHVVVFGGDLIDAYECSRFDKRRDRQNSLQEELDAAAVYVSRVLRYAPKAAVHWTLGNHEHRLSKYTDREAPALATLRRLRVPEVLRDCVTPATTIYPYGRGFSIGDVFFTHGSLIRKGATNSARALFEREGRSVSIGHTHRLGQSFVRMGNKVYRNYENGCLCSIPLPYTEETPDWQNGFGAFCFWGKKNLSHTWFSVDIAQPDPLYSLSSMRPRGPR